MSHASKTLFLIGVLIGAPIVSRADALWSFANLPLSENAKTITLEQEKSLFPEGPSKAEDGVVGRPEVLIGTSAPVLKDSFLKPLSGSEAIQTVILETGENITVVHGGWEYQSIGIRFSSKGKLKGRTDYEKAANALERMEKLGLFDPYPWKKVISTFRDLPVKEEWMNGYPIDGPDNSMNPQADVIRTGDLPDGAGSFVEISFVQGPL